MARESERERATSGSSSSSFDTAQDGRSPYNSRNASPNASASVHPMLGFNFREKVHTASAIGTILEQYSSNKILNEIVQNTDDAKSKIQQFILDRRSHGIDTLLDPALVHTQGPALLCVNDTKFTDFDWVAIRTIHGSNKRAEEMKTGKYGLGFRSCYHVTDNPHILSGRDLVVFDPHEDFQDPNGGGIRIQILSTDGHHYADQLDAFRPLLEGFEYDGTIIRLPLRTDAQLEHHTIKNEAFTPDDVRSLFMQFIENDLDKVLLFLKHIERIELREIDEEGQMHLLGCVEIENIDDVRENRSFLRDFGGGHVSGDHFVEFNCIIIKSIQVLFDSDDDADHNLSTSISQWRIGHSILDDDETAQVLSDRLGFDIGTRLKDDKLISHVALAFPLSNSHSTSTPFKGQLFTLLPLPIETQFPAHAHAIFALTPDRRSLKDQHEHGTTKESRENILVEWNKTIFSVFLPRLWGLLLTVLIDRDSPYEPWEAWPSLSLSSNYWNTVLLSLLQEVMRNEYEVFPTKDFGYISIRAGLVASLNDEDPLLDALLTTGIKIVQPPAEVYDLMRMMNGVTFLSPFSAHDQLVEPPHQTILHAADFDSQTKLRILTYLTRDSTTLLDVHTNLSGLRLVPTTRENQFIELLSASEMDTLHVLATKKTADLFQEADSSPMVALHKLPKAIQTLFQCQETTRGHTSYNVIQFDTNHLTDCLTIMLGNLDPEPEGGDSSIPLTQSSRSMDWFKLFWGWMTKQQDDIRNVDISQFHLIPTTRGLLRKPSDGVFTRHISNDLKGVLDDIGVPFLSKDIAKETFLSSARQAIRPSNSVQFVISCIQEDKIHSLDQPALVLIQTYFSAKSRSRALQSALLSKFCSFPIFPILVGDEKTGGVVKEMGSIEGNPIFVDAPGSPVPFIHHGSTLVDVSAPESSSLGIARMLDHRAASKPKNDIELLEWTIPLLSQQPPVNVNVLLHHIISRLYSLSPHHRELFGRQPVFPVQDSTIGSVDSSMLVDPSSSLAPLFERERGRLAAPALTNDTTMVAQLRTFSLIQSCLTPSIIEERIQYLSHLQHPLAKSKAIKLLQLLDRTWDSSFHPSLQNNATWIPAQGALYSSANCRPSTSRNKYLFDLTLPICDLGHEIKNKHLIEALGWHHPPSDEILVGQFMRAIEMVQDDQIDNGPRLLALINEMANRELECLAPLRSIVQDAAWIPLNAQGSALVCCDHILLRPSQLDGVGPLRQIPTGLYTQKAIILLVQLGCHLVIPVPVLCQVLDTLTHFKRNSDKRVTQAISLLDELSKRDLTSEERQSLKIPDGSGVFRSLSQIQYNDINQDSTSPHSYYANPYISKQLAGKLHLTFASSVALDDDEDDEDNDNDDDDLDDVEMGEDLCTRINGVLRDYIIDYSLNEFIANAVDAGATDFHLALDSRTFDFSTNRSLPKLMQDVLSGANGTLLLYNNATFSDRDYKGLRNVGKGGKSDEAGSIGRFGLGALTLFHFTDLPIVVSDGSVMVLDPSGEYLPPKGKRKRTTLYRRIAKAKRLGLLDRIHELWDFDIEKDNYSGTIFILPLRTPGQPNALSNTFVSMAQIEEITKINSQWYEQAKNSLFFTPLRSIEVLRTVQKTLSSRIVRLKYDVLWNVSQTSRNLSQNTQFHTYQRDIKLTGVKGSSTTEHWAIGVYTVPRSQIPEEHVDIMERHQLLRGDTIQVGIALPQTAGTLPRRLFSTLMLPIQLTLPIHVSGAFILASDRQNLRFDSKETSGDTDPPEIGYNRWLLQNPVVKAYQHTLNFARDKPFGRKFDHYSVWPVVPEEIPEDPISSTIRKAFYQSLSNCTLPICTNSSGIRISPAEGTFPGQESAEIWKLMSHLPTSQSVCFQTEAVSEQRVARECMISPVRHVNAEFLGSLLLDTENHQPFFELITEDIHILDAVLLYILRGKDKAPLDGLPLLLLCGQQHPRCFESPSSPIYYHTQDLSSLLPPNQLLHPDAYSLDTRKLIFKANMNIASLSSESLVAFLANTLPRQDKVILSPTLRGLVHTFWNLSSDPAVELPTIWGDTDVEAIPLFSSRIEHQFISRAYFRTSCLLSSELDSEGSLGDIFENLGLTLVDDLGKYGEVLQAVGTSLSLQTVVEKVRPNLLQELLPSHLNTIAQWVKDAFQPIFLPELETRIRLREWEIWECRQGGQLAIDAATSFQSAKRLSMFAEDLSTPIYMDAILPYLSASRWFAPFSDQLSCLDIYSTKRRSGKSPIDRRDNPSELPVHRVDRRNILELLTIPRTLRQTALEQYRTFLDVLLTISFSGYSPLQHTIRVPNEDLRLVPANELYDNSTELFGLSMTRSFLGRSPFIHTSLRDLQNRLRAAGMKYQIDFDSFKTCVQAIDDDVGAGRPSLAAARIAFTIYASTLPRVIMSASTRWNELADYKFIPRATQRRRHYASHGAVQTYCRDLPLIVSPNDIILARDQSICWSQRALFREGDDLSDLISLNKKIGRPTAPDVVEHLRTLALRVNSDHSGNQDFLRDIQKTYDWLHEHEDASGPILSGHADECLFLNVEDPNTMTWVWRSASSLVFNLEYDEPAERLFVVRSSLSNFRSLLQKSGAHSLDLDRSSAMRTSTETIDFREILANMRRDGNQVDVRFVPTLATDLGIDYNEWELGAHKLFLSAALPHFSDLYNSPMRDRESGELSFFGTKFEACSFLSYMYTLSFRLPDLSTDDGSTLATSLLDCLLGPQNGDSGLLRTADAWGIDDLKDYIADIVIQKSLITPTTHQYILGVAERYQTESLKERCEEFAVRNEALLNRLSVVAVGNPVE